MILYFKRYNVILCTVILTVLIINKILNLLRYNNNILILHNYYNFTQYISYFNSRIRGNGDNDEQYLLAKEKAICIIIHIIIYKYER